MEVTELAPGLWSWTATHRDAQVRCFYLEGDDATVVVDPFVPADEADRFWRALDRDVERRARPVAVVLTHGAHVRSAGVVAKRYAAEVWGHEHARAKVGGATFHALSPGDTAPGGARVLPFDQAPDGSGTPLYFPDHAAL